MPGESEHDPSHYCFRLRFSTESAPSACWRYVRSGVSSSRRAIRSVSESVKPWQRSGPEELQEARGHRFRDQLDAAEEAPAGAATAEHAPAQEPRSRQGCEVKFERRTVARGVWSSSDPPCTAARCGWIVPAASGSRASGLRVGQESRHPQRTCTIQIQFWSWAKSQRILSTLRSLNAVLPAV